MTIKYSSERVESALKVIPLYYGYPNELENFLRALTQAKKMILINEQEQLLEQIKYKLCGPAWEATHHLKFTNISALGQHLAELFA